MLIKNIGHFWRDFPLSWAADVIVVSHIQLNAVCAFVFAVVFP